MATPPPSPSRRKSPVKPAASGPGRPKDLGKRAAILERIGLTPQTIARDIVEELVGSPDHADHGNARGEPSRRVDADHAG